MLSNSYDFDGSAVIECSHCGKRKTVDFSGVFPTTISDAIEEAVRQVGWDVKYDVIDMDDNSGAICCDECDSSEEIDEAVDFLDQMECEEDLEWEDMN